MVACIEFKRLLQVKLSGAIGGIAKFARCHRRRAITAPPAGPAALAASKCQQEDGGVAPEKLSPWASFMQHGFVVIDLNVTQEEQYALKCLSLHMAACAQNPWNKGNRGPGRTCVNNTKHVEDNQWANVLSIIMKSPEVSMVLSKIPGGVGFYDCGGDVVEAGAACVPPAGKRNPCEWHRDYRFYFRWLSISVLAEPTEANQGPLVLQSWSDESQIFTFSGHTGLCVIRDVYTMHRGSRNSTHKRRAMPSFRFVSKRERQPLMTIPQLREYLRIS